MDDELKREIMSIAADLNDIVYRGVRYEVDKTIRVYDSVGHVGKRLDRVARAVGADMVAHLGL
jgi:hypothetical protein